MALTKILSEFTYRSSGGGQSYHFTVVVDGQSLISVRNIQSPYGLLIDSVTSLPQSVVDDIATAVSQVETLMGVTSAVNGTLAFAGETSKPVVFATAFANTNYRVSFSKEDFIAVRVVSKTTLGFTVETSVTYTGDVGFDVFV
jgi:hypothetical protein